jgi:putative PIG3 family NAD(P)H quinone oxidoreductase
MRAVIITEPGDPGVLKLGTVPDPVPGSDEVLIRVRATALNRADLLQRRGFYPPPPPTDPRIPGLECAGVVERADAARTLAEGTRVMALLPGAGYSEYVSVHAGLTLPIPESLDFVRAAAVPEAFLTAFDALFVQLQVGVGETVLVHAAGSGVGTAAIQLLRAAGALTLGTSRTQAKLDRCVELGLDHPILLSASDWTERVLAQTGGRGVDAILDLVGGEYLEGNLNVLAERGRMIVVGTPAGSRAPVDLGLLLRQRLLLRGTNLRRRSLAEKLDLVARFRRRILPMLAKEHLVPVVDRVFPWTEAPEAHCYMEANRNFGKIVLTVG